MTAPRKDGPQSAPCPECARLVSHLRGSPRCPECRRAAYRESHPLGVCPDCGTGLRHRNAKRCPPCSEVAKRQYNAIHEAAFRKGSLHQRPQPLRRCLDCPAPVYGPRARRCLPCARHHKRESIRAHLQRYRADPSYRAEEAAAARDKRRALCATPSTGTGRVPRLR